MTAPRPESARAAVVGLLGGVCSGKSTVARMMAEQGFEVIDADEIGHDVLEQAKVKKELLDAFGQDIFRDEGSVDRPKLGRCVFRCKPCLEKLNSIVHPVILDEIARRVRRLRARADGAPAVLDAALILEKGLQDQYCDLLVFVDAPDAARQARARRKRRWGARELALRDAAQIPVEEKRQAAHFVIDNSGTEQQLREAMHDVTDQIRKRLSSAPA